MDIVVVASQSMDEAHQNIASQYRNGSQLGIALAIVLLKAKIILRSRWQDEIQMIFASRTSDEPQKIIAQPGGI